MSDDGTRAVRILDDLCNGMFYLFKVFRAPAEKSKACIAVVDNRSEWLVDFMGDGGSQCTQRGDPADVREVRLHLTQSFFGSLALSQSSTKATPSFPLPSNNAPPTRTGTRLPSLRKNSFSKVSQIPVAAISAKACSLLARHSSGVSSLQLRPD